MTALGDVDDQASALIAEMRACRVCADTLPHEPNPVFQLDPRARIAIVGQAPGLRAHEASTPFLDRSGDRLRSWLGVDAATFYDPACFAIVPAGLCFPGYDSKGGDRPPRKECAPLWQARAFAVLTKVETIVLPGAYGHAIHLGRARCRTLTETVQNWRAYGPRHWPLPHPSWRNNGWMKRHAWFERELLPMLRARVAEALGWT